MLSSSVRLCSSSTTSTRGRCRRDAAASERGRRSCSRNRPSSPSLGVAYVDAMPFLWTLCGGDAQTFSRAIPPPQVHHSRPPDSDAMTAPHDPTTRVRQPHRPPPRISRVGATPSGTGATRPIPLSPVEGVRWPQPPQDAVLQDAPYAAVGPVAAAAPTRWSGRRTAAIAALALALTSAGALAAAAESQRHRRPDRTARGCRHRRPGTASSGRAADSRASVPSPVAASRGSSPGWVCRGRAAATTERATTDEPLSGQPGTRTENPAGITLSGCTLLG